MQRAVFSAQSVGAIFHITWDDCLIQPQLRRNQTTNSAETPLPTLVNQILKERLCRSSFFTLRDRWPTRMVTRFAFAFGLYEFSMPTKDGVRLSNRRELSKLLSSESFRLHRQNTPLIVTQQDSFAPPAPREVSDSPAEGIRLPFPVLCVWTH